MRAYRHASHQVLQSIRADLFPSPLECLPELSEVTGRFSCPALASKSPTELFDLIHVRADTWPRVLSPDVRKMLPAPHLSPGRPMSRVFLPENAVQPELDHAARENGAGRCLLLMAERKSFSTMLVHFVLGIERRLLRN